MSSDHIPVEILYNILGRLPVEDIIRCRSVCKAWRDFVVNPDFVSTHLDFQTDCSRRCLMYYRTRQKFVFSVFHDTSFAEHSNLEVPFDCETSFFKVVGSVNGLICLSNSDYLFGRTLYLWNPSIWKLKVIRASCFHLPKDVRKTFFAIGFGYHQRTNDYKIVRITYFKDVKRAYVEKEPPKGEVFSLARNSWRNVGTTVGCWYAYDNCSTAVVNDCVHWTAVRTRDESDVFVLVFDFDSDKFGEIRLPNYIHDGDGQSGVFEPIMSVEVLRGSLALIVSFYKFAGEIECCNIWVMSEYGVAESWSKQYFFVPNKSCFRFLGIVGNGDLMLDTCDQEGVISYDFDKQEYKHLGVAEYIHNLVTFRESLVLYKEGIRLTPRKGLLVKGGIHLGKRKWSMFRLLQRKWR